MGRIPTFLTRIQTFCFSLQLPALFRHRNFTLSSGALHCPSKWDDWGRSDNVVLHESRSSHPCSFYICDSAIWGSYIIFSNLFCLIFLRLCAYILLCRGFYEGRVVLHVCTCYCPIYVSILKLSYLIAAGPVWPDANEAFLRSPTGNGSGIRRQDRVVLSPWPVSVRSLTRVSSFSLLICLREVDLTAQQLQTSIRLHFLVQTSPESIIVQSTLV